VLLKKISDDMGQLKRIIENNKVNVEQK